MPNYGQRNDGTPKGHGFLMVDLDPDDLEAIRDERNKMLSFKDTEEITEYEFKKPQELFVNQDSTDNNYIASMDTSLMGGIGAILGANLLGVVGGVIGGGVIGGGGNFDGGGASGSW